MGHIKQTMVVKVLYPMLFNVFSMMLQGFLMVNVVFIFICLCGLANVTGDALGRCCDGSCGMRH